MAEATPRGVSGRSTQPKPPKPPAAPKPPEPPAPPAQPPAAVLTQAVVNGPLTAEEMRRFMSLAGRMGLASSVSDQMAAATAGLGVRIGKPYRALTNLSLPRRGRKDGDPNDLVVAGETVWLTDAEAAAFNRHGDRDGRRIAVLQPLEEAEANASQPRIPPRALSGPIQRPVAPAHGDTGPRPDPPGSSTLQVLERVPEMSEPAPGDENTPPVDGPDALDIPPSGARR